MTKKLLIPFTNQELVSYVDSWKLDEIKWYDRYEFFDKMQITQMWGKNYIIRSLTDNKKYTMFPSDLLKMLELTTVTKGCFSGLSWHKLRNNLYQGVNIFMSKIEWTEQTWNPVTGCNKVSQGCKNCYAERMAKRLKAMGVKKYANGFEVTLHPEALDIPLRRKKPTTYFVNSMSDLFHDKIPAKFLWVLFTVMKKAHQHTFQCLTKRSERLAVLSDGLSWPDNVWMGVSVENADTKHRINDLRSTPAVVKFLSIEPLLGDVGTLNLEGIHWVIVGGESGPGARPCNLEWVRSIRDQCIAQDTAFFFKQWGGVNKKKSGRLLDGRVWDEMPR